MHQLSTDSHFAFVLEEYLALSNGGGAASGEVLRIASQIKPGDSESFYTQFNYVAGQVHGMAERALQSNDSISAREAYFRAAAYYRAAGFYLIGNATDPRIVDLWDKQLADYAAALELMHPVAPTRVSIAGSASNGTVKFKIPSYFYPADRQAAKRRGLCGKRLPTLVVGTGYDGPQEDLYHGFCKGIVERGWNCLTYEGPGQPTVIRKQRIGFVPDWWNVISPVVDFLESRDDVDMSRLGLVGYSFGGLLQPLAATVEHRFAAVVAIDGLISIHDALVAAFPPDLQQLYHAGDKADFNKYIDGVLASPKTPTVFRWYIEQTKFVFTVDNFYDALQGLGEFSLSKKKLDAITSPVFVASGQDDGNAPNQPEQVARWLGSRAYYHLFKTDVGAGEHCSLGAEQQVQMEVFEWLSGVLRA